MVNLPGISRPRQQYHYTMREEGQLLEEELCPSFMQVDRKGGRVEGKEVEGREVEWYLQPLLEVPYDLCWPGCPGCVPWCTVAEGNDRPVADYVIRHPFRCLFWVGDRGKVL